VEWVTELRNIHTAAIEETASDAYNSSNTDVNDHEMNRDRYTHPHMVVPFDKLLVNYRTFVRHTNAPMALNVVQRCFAVGFQSRNSTTLY
jgi:hypothetical protein